MKKCLQFSFLLVLSLGFSGCLEEAEINYEPKVLEGSEYLNSYTTPAFFYHYEQRNTETGENQGWIIDNHGRIRKYQNLHVLLSEVNTFDAMDRFLEGTAIEGKVDVQELVTHYKQNTLISRLDPDISYNDLSTDITTTFYAYSLTSRHTESHNDNMCMPSSSLTQSVMRSTLDSKGKVLVQHQSERVKTVLDYLEGVNVAFGL